MIYYISGDERREFIDSVTVATARIFRDFDGSPRAEHWQPVYVERVVEDEHGAPLLPADLLWLSASKLFMRTRAVVALRDLLETGGEILPLTTNDGVNLFVLNVTCVLDALDEERATLDRFPDTGKLLYIRAPAFHESMVRDVPFFKLPFYGSEMFVGESFKQRVDAAGLVGLEFKPAWSPEGGPVRR